VSNRRIKILHCVESYYPSKGGMQEVVKQLSERLVKMGHDVTVATRKIQERDFVELNGVKIIDFNISGNLVSGITGETETYRNLLLSGRFDVITFFAAQQWATDLALDILPQIPSIKVSVPTGYSGLYWSNYKDYYEKMKQWIKHYDMNVYLSNDYRDINFARANNITKLTIIPNGAAADEFEPDSVIDVRKQLDIPEKHKIVLLVGSYTGLKGHREAVEIMLRSSLKDVTLLMIGNDGDNFYRQYIKHPVLGLLFIINKITRRKKIIFKSFTREFTVAAYKQADLFLFPSNIECSPVVLFECAAAKLPFISSDAGNAKEIAEWTRGGIVAGTFKDADGMSHVNIEECVKLTEALLKDEKQRKQMGETAFKAWREKFSWEKITQQYEQLYLSLVK